MLRTVLVLYLLLFFAVPASANDTELGERQAIPQPPNQPASEPELLHIPESCLEKCYQHRKVKSYGACERECPPDAQTNRDSLKINGKDWGITKQSVRQQVDMLSSYGGNDMGSRKKYFSDIGWQEYQKYLDLVISRLQSSSSHFNDWNLIPDQKTEQFSQSDNGTVNFSYDCTYIESDGDLIGGGLTLCRLAIKFTKEPDSGDLLISSWKFIPDVMADLKQKAERGDVKAQEEHPATPASPK